VTATDRIARTRVYRDGQLAKEDFPVEDISGYLHEPDTVLWVDLCAPDTEDLEIVAVELGLHPLAIEDAVHPGQRPKFDRYASHDFLNVYATRLDTTTGELALSELAAFMTPTALVTVRKDEAFNIDAVVDRWNTSTDQPSTVSDFCCTG
jgi:magnesium transporter